MTSTNESNHEITLPACAKRAWVPRALEELPRLTKLTLQSPISGRGMITEGGGSTVF